MLLSRVAGAGSFFDFRSGSMQISKSDPPPGSAPKNRTIFQKKLNIKTFKTSLNTGI